MTKKLYEAARAVTDLWYHFPGSGNEAAAMGRLRSILNDPYLLASPEEVKTARSEAGNDISVDDFAYASRADEGVWVQVWAWQPYKPTTNEYTCPACGFEWDDPWDCAVSDDCPKCGQRDVQPDGDGS